MSYTILSIEGNIGSGKSTLLEALKTYYKNSTHVIFADEPVKQWETIKDKEGKTILEKFYNNQNKYAFSFQMMAYISRLSILRKIVKEGGDKPIVIITERSLYTDKYIFAKMLYDQGKIEEVEYQIYLQWFEEFATDFPVHHCIYLKADPSICYERINKRSRSGEEVISMDYLESCHSYHNVYVEQMSKKLELDGNKDIYKDPQIVDEWIQKINELN